MATQAGSLRELFEAEVPSSVERAIVTGIVNAYRAAADHVSQFHHGPARDLVGHTRRGFLENELLELADRFENVVADSRPNVNGSYTHAVVRVGKILLTASKVNTSGSLPRPCNFRNEYARRYQLDLWNSNPVPTSDDVYAVLVHGFDQAFPQSPAFIDVLFPDETGSSVIERIDLVDRNRDLMPSLPIVVPAEDTDVVVNVTVKSDQEKAN